MDLDGHVVKFPGEELSYRRPAPRGDTTGLTTVLVAIDSLREAWEPLAAEAIVDCPMGEAPRAGLTKPHWLLSRTQIPPDVIIASVMRDPIRSSSDALSRSAIETWLRDAIASSGADDGRAEWRQLRFDATRVRVGPRDWRAAQTTVQLRTDAGILRAPIERDANGAWLSGPRDPAYDQPPVALHVLQEWGLLTLDLVVNYSFWLDDAEPAAAWLSQARAALEQLGWEPA